MRGGLLAAGVLVLVGCAVDTVSGPDTGMLVVDWTLNSSKDPSQCDASGASTLDVTVRSAGVRVAEFASDCRAFSESIVLGAGSYDADAVLLDPDGNARSTTLQLGPIYLAPGDRLIIPINFPSSSFF